MKAIHYASTIVCLHSMPFDAKNNHLFSANGYQNIFPVLLP